MSINEFDLAECIDTVIERGDAALGRVKEGGRNRVEVEGAKNLAIVVSNQARV